MIRRRRYRRQGFTLIELLVVISIIGILVGLLLPAVQSAREAGRRAQCQSNMKNVVLAVQGYITTKNAYPPAGVFGEDTNGTFSGAVLTDPTAGAIMSWMPGGSGAVGTPMYSWVVPLLPYLDAQELSDQWTMYANETSGKTSVPATVGYLDPGSGNTGGFAQLQPGQAANFIIGNTSIGVLKCPDDVTTQTGQGNLSYVVNGGFSLYHANPVGWVPSNTDGGATVSAANTWTTLTGTSAILAEIGVMQKMGVMFLQSALPQGNTSRIPWNINSTPSSIADGSSNTILLSENTLAGVSTGTQYSNSLQTNWACPLPTFTMFIGPTNVCGTPSKATGLNCTGGALQANITTGTDGTGWAQANKVGTFANINGGGTLTIEGGYPFSNSGHPSGCNMGFCDGGVRFVTNTIDGTVYSKMITSAGSKLPFYVKQLPLNQDAFAQ